MKATNNLSNLQAPAVPDLQKSFSFEYPLVQKVIRNCRIQNEFAGNLVVEGSATPKKGGSITDPLEEQFSVDIDFIKWNGQDIKPVLETEPSGLLLLSIYEAALNHTAYLFYYEAPTPAAHGQLPTEYLIIHKEII